VLLAVCDIVRALPPGIPVVLDPVISAGSGSSLMNDDVRRAMVVHLWPLVTLRTPNTREAGLLAAASGLRTIDDLLADAQGSTLVKGADEQTVDVEHRLYRGSLLYSTYQWPRVNGSFHGSGRTLASAVAALLASGLTLPLAVVQALDFTWHAVARALDVEGTHYLSNRQLR
jgi:hydroxymethylpyrimidine/phosphomethylpyrimidine kinase